MPRRTWPANVSVPASDYQEDLQNQVINRCTAATKGTLFSGYHWYEGDTDLHKYSPDGVNEILIPKQAVAKGSITDTGVGGFITAGPYDINGSLMTFDAEAGVRYEIQWNWRLAGTLDDIFVVKAWRNTTEVDLQMDLKMTAGGVNSPYSWNVVDTPGHTTVTYKLTIERTVGSLPSPYGGQIKGGTDCWAKEFDLA